MFYNIHNTSSITSSLKNWRRNLLKQDILIEMDLQSINFNAFFSICFITLQFTEKKLSCNAEISHFTFRAASVRYPLTSMRKAQTWNRLCISYLKGYLRNMPYQWHPGGPKPSKMRTCLSGTSISKNMAHSAGLSTICL